MAGLSSRQGKAGQALSFVNLRVHSAFSLLEGALPIDRIVEFAVADNAPAVAIADTGNLFGALDFAQKAVKAGIQPIIGCQMDVDFADEAATAGQGHSNAPPGRWC
jgi:DNA polymerase III subunit alpha